MTKLCTQEWLLLASLVMLFGGLRLTSTTTTTTLVAAMTVANQDLDRYFRTNASAQIAMAEERVALDMYTYAFINYTYYAPEPIDVHFNEEKARYGEGKVMSVHGKVVHISDAEDYLDDTACSADILGTKGDATPALGVSWIALVRRGGCTFEEKVQHVYNKGAIGVIIYNDKPMNNLEKMQIKGKSRNITAVITYLEIGVDMALKVDQGFDMTVAIIEGRSGVRPINSLNRTSVLFVSISFIVLMVISLVWLIFYYIQRFRYMQTKDQQSRHLCTVTKKAIMKIPTRTGKSSDEKDADSDCCAICIETYKASDCIRVLPCKHEFHKNCIDPWLIEHRTCPMCKLDVLRFYGFVVGDQINLSPQHNTSTSAVVPAPNVEEDDVPVIVVAVTPVATQQQQQQQQQQSQTQSLSTSQPSAEAAANSVVAPEIVATVGCPSNSSSGGNADGGDASNNNNNNNSNTATNNITASSSTPNLNCNSSNSSHSHINSASNTNNNNNINNNINNNNNNSNNSNSSRISDNSNNTCNNNNNSSHPDDQNLGGDNRNNRRQLNEAPTPITTPTPTPTVTSTSMSIVVASSGNTSESDASPNSTCSCGGIQPSVLLRQVSTASRTFLGSEESILEFEPDRSTNISSGVPTSSITNGNQTLQVTNRGGALTELIRSRDFVIDFPRIFVVESGGEVVGSRENLFTTTRMPERSQSALSLANGAKDLMVAMSNKLEEQHGLRKLKKNQQSDDMTKSLLGVVSSESMKKRRSRSADGRYTSAHINRQEIMRQQKLIATDILPKNEQEERKRSRRDGTILRDLTDSSYGQSDRKQRQFTNCEKPCGSKECKESFVRQMSEISLHELSSNLNKQDQLTVLPIDVAVDQEKNQTAPSGDSTIKLTLKAEDFELN